MEIILERSGGVAGLRRTYRLDTNNLPEEQARQVEELVKQCQSFTIPPSSPSGEGADRFQYRLNITSEESSHTIDLSEPASPNLQALIKIVSELGSQGFEPR
jgi:hypothetical protein